MKWLERLAWIGNCLAALLFYGAIGFGLVVIVT